MLRRIQSNLRFQIGLFLNDNESTKVLQSVLKRERHLIRKPKKDFV
jgi:hypothetical protein